MNLLKRIYQSFFRVCRRPDLSQWEHAPQPNGMPIYGVYHVMLGNGWQTLVRKQVDNLKKSGLLDATTTLFVSCIATNQADVELLKSIIGSPKLKIIACHADPTQYEYPALRHLKALANHEDCLVYYFHSKGISYQSVTTNDALFRSFYRKIEAWRELLEFFIFTKWKVAVNVLASGYDSYGCLRWPPRAFTMYSGNFWWAASRHIRHLPELTEENIRGNRFYSEVWLFSRKHRQFSPFDSIADPYFVRFPRSIYAEKNPPLWDRICFSLAYNARKVQKHVFHYNYKKRCQQRFQQLSNKL